MDRLMHFIALWLGSFLLLGGLVGWFIGQPLLPIINAKAAIGFFAVLAASIILALCFSKPRKKSKQ